jgi:ABC-type polysaccharide/polyol phosphate export permease
MAQMFQIQQRRTSTFSLATRTLGLIFHAAIRHLRRTSGNAVLGLVLAIFQSMLMVMIMYFLFELLGVRRIAVRGDFMLYVMSGVFMFMTHVKAIGAVSGADGPTSPMMMHAPMNPIISICGAALGSLYEQVLAAMVILFFYHAVFTPIEIEDPVHLLGIFLLSWLSGVGIGMVLLSARPWQPEVVGILTTIIMRANVIASGKMLLANKTSASMRAMFDWNPLFHTIDQGRGFMFLNYTPRYTSIEYPVYVTLVCVMIGLMAEFFTRQYASASWGKRR